MEDENKLDNWKGMFRRFYFNWTKSEDFYSCILEPFVEILIKEAYLRGKYDKEKD